MRPGQPFTMDLFLNREVAAAAAMTYNELAQVLEAKNPETGKLYQLSALNVFKMSDLGTGALEDGIFVRGDWIEDEDNQDIAKRFLKASFRGWTYCRDNPEPCLQTVLDNGPTLPEGHQRCERDQCTDLAGPEGHRRNGRELVQDHERHRDSGQDHQTAGHGLPTA